jgi:deoxyribodipyrimidine photo-lyase
MTTSIALFTRDLRVHDNPVLRAACEADRVVPLFVVDSGITRAGVRRPEPGDLPRRVPGRPGHQPV